MIFQYYALQMRFHTLPKKKRGELVIEREEERVKR
jgi:hypothetical protein